METVVILACCHEGPSPPNKRKKAPEKTWKTAVAALSRSFCQIRCHPFEIFEHFMVSRVLKPCKRHVSFPLGRTFRSVRAQPASTVTHNLCPLRQIFIDTSSPSAWWGKRKDQQQQHLAGSFGSWNIAIGLLPTLRRKMLVTKAKRIKWE